MTPPSGARLRARSRAYARPAATTGGRLGDLYVLVLAVAIGLSALFSVAVHARGTGDPDAPLGPGAVAALTALVGAAAVLALAVRLGPISVSAAQALWWLDRPVDRGSLLRRTWAGWTAFAAGAGTLGGVLAGVFAGLGTVGIVTAGAGGGALVVALVDAAVLRQTGGSFRLGAIPRARLDGATAEESLLALLVLDTRALGRALTVESTTPGRLRLPRLPTRTRARGRPFAAVVLADLLLLRRPRTRLLRVASTLALPALATAAGAGGGLRATAFAAGALAAATTAAEGARRARERPVLFPLSDRAVTLARTVVPALVLIPWTLVAGALTGSPALALLSVPAWAAGAVRAARRPAADLSAPAVETPFGPVPPGAIGAVIQGPDLALLGASPLLIALITSDPSPVALVVQAATATVAVHVVTRP